jgi:hypothetical protein
MHFNRTTKYKTMYFIEGITIVKEEGDDEEEEG